MQSKQPGKAAAETAADLINENEAVFEKDESFLFNPLMKQATCILQEDSDPIDLINSLPHDLQALVMLYTGEGRNKTGERTTSICFVFIIMWSPSVIFNKISGIHNRFS